VIENFKRLAVFLLVTDGDLEFCAAARDRNQAAHVELPGKESRGCGKSPFHIQTTHSFHGSHKSWMRSINGVAAKYLANYMGWHRHLFEGNHDKEPLSFIALSFNPLLACPQLTMIWRKKYYGVWAGVIAFQHG
jgi:hypothetical protein